MLTFSFLIGRNKPITERAGQTGNSLKDVSDIQLEQPFLNFLTLQKLLKQCLGLKEPPMKLFHWGSVGKMKPGTPICTPTWAPESGSDAAERHLIKGWLGY